MIFFKIFCQVFIYLLAKAVASSGYVIYSQYVMCYILVFCGVVCREALGVSSKSLFHLVLHCVAVW